MTFNGYAPSVNGALGEEPQDSEYAESLSARSLLAASLHVRALDMDLQE